LVPYLFDKSYAKKERSYWGRGICGWFTEMTKNWGRVG